MNVYKNLKFPSIIFAIVGLFWTLDKQSFGPIILAFGIIFATFAFKNKKLNNMAFSTIVVAVLAIMFILEYFIVPIENITFYVLLLIMSIGIFLNFYFSLKPQNFLTQREKILSWTGSILFGISLFGLLGIIYNNFILSLSLGASVLIMFVIIRLIRRRILKDNALKNEFNEAYTKNTKEHWFRYKIGRFPKPVRWQGWACYGIIFFFFLVALIFDMDPNSAVVILLASIFIVIIIAMLKSNFRESVMEYRESLKK